MNPATVTVEIATDAGANRPPSDNMTGVGRAVVARLADVPADALVKTAQQVIDVVAEAFKPRADGPESCAVKFGLKISGEGNVVMAKIGSELNLEVTITWKR